LRDVAISSGGVVGAGTTGVPRAPDVAGSIDVPGVSEIGGVTGVPGPIGGVPGDGMDVRRVPSVR
jgi:hypothetical protein